MRRFFLLHQPPTNFCPSHVPELSAHETQNALLQNGLLPVLRSLRREGISLWIDSFLFPSVSLLFLSLGHKIFVRRNTGVHKMTLPWASTLGVSAVEQNPHLNLSPTELWEAFCFQTHWQHRQWKVNNRLRKNGQSSMPPQHQPSWQPCGSPLAAFLLLLAGTVCFRQFLSRQTQTVYWL